MEETKGTWGGSIMTALWVIAAVVIIALIAYLWNKNCSEKAEIAAGVQRLVGRVDAIEPAVTAQGNSIYKLNGVVSATVQGVGDLKECTNDKLDFLEGQVLFQGNRRSCGGCGNREFKQTQTYNLATTAVTVEDTCRQ